QQRRHTTLAAKLGLDIRNAQEALNTSVAQGVDMQQQRSQQAESALQVTGG
ncbi:hypothetical protein BGZ98_005155, partial [Dissophora globulifera]